MLFVYLPYRIQIKFYLILSYLTIKYYYYILLLYSISRVAKQVGWRGRNHPTEFWRVG